MKPSRLKLMHNQKGFTLTEMLIVIALIAMVGTFVVGKIMSQFGRAKVDATKIQIRQLSVILDDFKRDCNFYPLTDQKLDALTAKPTEGRECKNYDPNAYLKKVPKDAWNKDFLYTSDGVTFEIKSLGADEAEGGEGTDKDISSAEID